MTANDSHDLTLEQKAHYDPIVRAHSTKTQPVYCLLLDTIYCMEMQDLSKNLSTTRIEGLWFLALDCEPHSVDDLHGAKASVSIYKS